MKIIIEHGEIYTTGYNKIGTAKKELKHGYHPAILVEVGNKYKWFEIDEPDLLAKIADFARTTI